MNATRLLPGGNRFKKVLPGILLSLQSALSLGFNLSNTPYYNAMSASSASWGEFKRDDLVPVKVRVVQDLEDIEIAELIQVKTIQVRDIPARVLSRYAGEKPDLNGASSGCFWLVYLPEGESIESLNRRIGEMVHPVGVLGEEKRFFTVLRLPVALRDVHFVTLVGDASTIQGFAGTVTRPAPIGCCNPKVRRDDLKNNTLSGTATALLLGLALAAPAAFGQNSVEAPEYCSSPTGPGQSFMCDTRALWTANALFEWELQAGVEALGGAGKFSEMEELKSRAQKWREELGSACPVSMARAVRQSCFESEFRAHARATVSLQNRAGLATPEMADAEKRETEFVRAEEAAAARLKQQAARDQAIAQERKEAEAAAREAEQNAESRRNGLILVAIFLVGMAFAGALYFVRKRSEANTGDASGSETVDEVPEPATPVAFETASDEPFKLEPPRAPDAQEPGEASALPSGGARALIYGLAAACLAAVLGGMALISMTPSKQSAGSSAQELPPYPRQPPANLTLDQLRDFRTSEVIRVGRLKGPRCAPYAQQLELVWRLHRQEGHSVKPVAEVFFAGAQAGCWPPD